MLLPTVEDEKMSELMATQRLGLPDMMRKRCVARREATKTVQRSRFCRSCRDVSQLM